MELFKFSSAIEDVSFNFCVIRGQASVLGNLVNFGYYFE